MKKKVYIETTIPSYLIAGPSRDIIILGRQNLTREWWENNRQNYELYISAVVLDEVKRGNAKMAKKRMDLLKGITILPTIMEVQKLAEKYFKYFNFPEKAERDAYHIAYAVYYNMDYLLSWNCSHLSNAEILRDLLRYNSKLRLETPIICTIDEIMPYENF